jgi:carnitine-CoA ligase
LAVDFLDGAGSTIDSWIRWRARVDSEKVFVETADAAHTFAEFNQLVETVASGLIANGVRPGDMVGVYMANSFRYLGVVYGILRAGAVYVPCSTLAARDELHFQLTQTKVRTLFVDTEHAATGLELQREIDDLLWVVRADDGSNADSNALTPLEHFTEQARPVPTGVASPDTLAMIMYTSGTTSRPKGIMFSHGNLMSIANTTQQVFQWRRDDRFLHFYPMYHMNGGLTSILPVITTGATVVLRPKFTASGFGELLCESDATFCNMNSTHVKMVLAHPQTAYDAQHRTWRMLLGLSLSPEESEEFEKRFHTRLCATYGLTEACGTNIAIPPTDPDRRGCAGRVVRGYSAKVVDDNDDEVSTGTMGELCVRSYQRHGICQGYFADPQLTMELIRGDWLYTGDMGYFDDDGYFWFVERKKDTIKRAGFNVAPAEVERVLRDHPAVRDVAVVGTPDPMREEEIVAFVVCEADAPVTEGVLVEVCRASLSEYKVPQKVVFVDALPVNFLGKLERRVLREWAVAGVEQA